jgi:F-type H+-transporting ATPase subunit b
MLIDWFTVIAQAINFIVLILLLKKFLYGPVIRAVDAREKKISDQLGDANLKKELAEKEHQEFLEKNRDFNKKYNEMMGGAIKEAADRKSELLEKARVESVVLRERMIESFESEKKSLAGDIMEKTQNEVFSITRKVLKDLSSLTLENQIIEMFIQRLTDLDENELKNITAAVPVGERTFLVNTTFEIPESFRNRIENVIRNMVSGMIEDRRKSGVKVEFGKLPGLIGGIEIISGGYKIAWSISDYIGSMEKHVSELLKGKLDIKSTP